MRTKNIIEQIRQNKLKHEALKKKVFTRRPSGTNNRMFKTQGSSLFPVVADNVRTFDNEGREIIVKPPKVKIVHTSIEFNKTQIKNARQSLQP